MFIISLKSDRKKLVVILCCILAVAFILFMAFRGDKAVIDDGGINLKASNESERIAFLSQFGWDVDTDPVKVEEVIIPTEFNEVYEKYNQLQLTQNFDLTDYAGKSVKKWTYSVKNYPGYAAESGLIQVNMLVLDGVVIGGDVSNIEQNGFMQTFDFPENFNQ